MVTIVYCSPLRASLTPESVGNDRGNITDTWIYQDTCDLYTVRTSNATLLSYNQ